MLTSYSVAELNCNLLRHCAATIAPGGVQCGDDSER